MRSVEQARATTGRLGDAALLHPLSMLRLQGSRSWPPPGDLGPQALGKEEEESVYLVPLPGEG